jgi:iron(III) transport system ATP-binding protein
LISLKTTATWNVPMRCLSLHHLSRSYGAIAAVDKVTLEIQPGELFFLLGPSGCGKTTLLRLIAGLAKPDMGRLLWGGEDITSLPVHRRGFGFVLQNVAFGLEAQGLARGEIDKRVADALVSVQLLDAGNRRVSKLSGGQQQRIGLARALVTRPSLLLLDEPLSSLDAPLRSELGEEIRRLCKAAQITAICVTHDPAEAAALADRVALMSSGRIVQTGTPTEVSSPLNSAI